MPDELEEAMDEFKQELEEVWEGPTEEAPEGEEEPETPEKPELSVDAVAEAVVQRIARAAAAETEEPEDEGYPNETATAEEIEERVTKNSFKHLKAVQDTMDTLDEAFKTIGDVPADIQKEVKGWFRSATDPSSFTPQKAQQAVDFAIGKAVREGRYKPAQKTVRSASGPDRSLTTPGEGTPGIKREVYSQMKSGFEGYMDDKEIAAAYKERN